MHEPRFDKPDTAERLAFNVAVNEKLIAARGTPAAGPELLHLRLCYQNGWVAEDAAAVLLELSTPAGEKVLAEARAGGFPQEPTIPST